MASRDVFELIQKLNSGQIRRRDFIRSMAALGMSAAETGFYLREAHALRKPAPSTRFRTALTGVAGS